MAKSTYPDNYLDDRRRDSLTSELERLKARRSVIDAMTFGMSAEEKASQTLDIAAERATLETEIAHIERRLRDQAKHEDKKGFATLADEFRAALVDTKRMGYPLEVLEPSVRRRADDASRAMIPILHRAHRMVLAPEFTRLASELTRQPPSVLARLLDVARMPFSNLWLEWPQEERSVAAIARNYQKETDIPKRVGVLIWPVPGSDQVFQLTDVSGYPDQCGPGPIGMIFSMTKPIDDYSATYRVRYDDEVITGDPGDPAVKQDQFIRECAIGYHYMDGVRERYPDEVPLAEKLSKHAWISIAPPLGPLHRETIINALANKQFDVVERQQEWLGITAREINGLWRFLIAVLGLYNTGGGEFVFSETKQQPRRAFRSGTLPAYEYRVLKLSRPTRPEIVEQKLPPGPGTGAGRRWHTVPGNWHHRRLKTAECARHPKVCPIADWKKKYDPETNEGVGSDQYECLVCHRIRWFVPEHPRGNKELGIVDKGYKITSSKDERRSRPSHETIEVVQSLPPNVKIKTLPRFDALTHHGDGTHEHQKGRRNPRPE